MKDVFREQVKHALVKAGWTITQDPLRVQIGGVEYYIDLGAERLVAAERDGEKIAVEIKSFLGASITAEFHTALGQYLEYRLALEYEHPDRQLFLAIPVDVYQTFFALQFIQRVVEHYQLKLLVYDEEREAIVAWKK